MKNLVLTAYNPNWPIDFQRIREVIGNQLMELASDIQHVGSTSVVGLVAKPVIDIDIIIEDRPLLPKIIQRLETLGYEYRGDQGIADRFAFRQSSSFTPDNGLRGQWPEHHVYVCVAGSLALRNHLCFRDALQKNASLVEQYAQLKQSLVRKSISREEYGKLKTEFILEVLAQNGFSQYELDSIREANV